MLSFEPDEEQKMLVEAIEKFAANQMRKVYREAEEEGIIPGHLRQSGWDFGLLPAGIPEQYGGFGEYSVVTAALAAEAMAFGDLAISLAIATPALVGIPLLLSGTEVQKERYLPMFCEESPPSVTAAIIEPTIQYDPRELKTTADHLDGGYVLNGEKSLVPLASEADLILVYANENGNTQAFLVPGDADGLILGSADQLMGLRALPIYNISLQDCYVPAANKLGEEEGISFDLILNHSRVALAASAVGLANAAAVYARQYAKERIQFDEPIAHRQSIAFMLAEMAIEVDSARLMVWETAWKLDRGEDATKEATLMKQYVDQAVLRVADSTVQILGGYGYIREYPAELWLRNARGFSSFDGLAIV
ncbi:MAG TPA: acyl-CoA dehydrogenase family protein [Patescibacteria group bacterium]|jgi:alkylation response protein AidB-like acyl-CoA dehydrogenase|nr:acyl-CoA dehydrogenase family protein [Patescibacteria group bacterium]